MQSVIFSEPLAGLQAQALGLAERAGWSPQLRALRPHGPWARLPPRFWPNPVAVVAPAANAPLPNLVIGCGGMAAAVGAALRTRHRQVVHVQHPRMRPERFDAVVVNTHDRLTGANVIVTRTALHRVTAGRLAAASLEWRDRLAGLARPLVCVLVGGSNGRFRLDAAVGMDLAARLAAMMQADRVGVAVTPSRRTDPAIITFLRAALAPLGGWVWDGAGENPYFGMLALADAIVVTGDSVSMISEAVATFAPVMVARLPGHSSRIAAFTEGLMNTGRVRWFGGRAELWPVQPLDDTDEAAAGVQRLLKW